MATLSLREKVKRLGKSSQDRTLGKVHGWIRGREVKPAIKTGKHIQSSRKVYPENERGA